MLRSLFAGVSGLRNHQVRMDVIGNNISNVNTVAFKSGRVTFKEGFAQLLQGASRPPGDQGGINPIQIGLGMQIGSVDTLFSQGNIETTGISTDLAIQGDSFFTVRKGNQEFYTRSGNFQLDADGRLVSPTNGFIVQGRMADQGVMQSGITDIKLPFGQKTAARATANVRLAGNVNGSAAIFSDISADPTYATNPEDDPINRGDASNAGSFADSTITVYDSLGEKHELKVTLWKTAETTADATVTPPQNTTTWNWKVDPVELAKTGATIASGGSGTFKFGEDGTCLTTTPPIVGITTPNASQMTITINPGSGSNGLSQFGGTSTAVLRDQDGYTAGTLDSFSIDRTGTITGAFTNGTTQALGQLVLADFNNPAGLLRTGDNMYSVSGNSGGAVLGYALEGSQSQLTSGALEMSNVDLAQEFTSMIVAQRGFQANGRVITSLHALRASRVTRRAPIRPTGMTTAGSLSCPNCGAAAAPEARECSFCHARLATVACPHCFGMVFVGSRHCVHCGAQAREPKALDGTPWKCPRGHGELRGVAIGGAQLGECPACAGLWVEEDAFQRIVTDRAREAVVPQAGVGTSAVTVPVDAVRYIPCCDCGKIMNRVNFSRTSGIILDACRGHGVWCDADELHRVVEFVRAGGMDGARRKEVEMLELERKRLSFEKMAQPPETRFTLARMSPHREAGFRAYATIGRGVATLFKLLGG